jgi:hypothetical protein
MKIDLNYFAEVFDVYDFLETVFQVHLHSEREKKTDYVLFTSFFSFNAYRILNAFVVNMNIIYAETNRCEELCQSFGGLTN